MDMYQHRRERLVALIRDKFSGLRKSLADASGWSEARISQILSPTYRDGRAFSEKIARKLEEDLSLQRLYFDLGAVSASLPETPPASEYMRVQPINEDSPGIVAIRKVTLRLSAGIMGFVADPDPDTAQSFNLDEDWITRNRYNADELLAIEVTGESMEPRLYRGDLVVVNTGDTRPVDGQVFAVNYEGEAVVKRLSRDMGKWWLTSDNPDQQRFPRKVCEGNNCLIIGKVVLKKSENI
jgi:phage repressor protein C with HTH and peptisase S24 domain